MAETFSHQFCSLAPCGAGGRVTTGARMHNCLLEVRDGELSLIQAPATLVTKVPAAAVEIVTPATLRRIGTAVVVKLDGRLLAVEFDGVYRPQRAHANGRKPSLGTVVLRAFSLKTSPRCGSPSGSAGKSAAISLPLSWPRALATGTSLGMLDVDGLGRRGRRYRRRPCPPRDTRYIVDRDLVLGTEADDGFGI